MGEECNGYMLFCCDSSYSKEITFALDNNYTQLKTTLSLRSVDNDIPEGVWIEFYSIENGKEISIGETKRFKAGTRPTEIEIPLDGVTDLKIKTNFPSIHEAAFLLTEGIFIK